MPGEAWALSIGLAINQAAFVIFVASHNSDASVRVANELEYAREISKPILPILIDKDGREAIVRRLPDFEWIDFCDDSGYEDAFRLLLGHLPKSLYQRQPLPQQKPKSKGYVFISYVEEDSNFVKHLREFLKERGYGYWDYQDSDRDYHTQLSLELEEVIRGAAATLSVLSPDWKKSKWTAKEFLFSEQVNTPVFLLMAREMEPTLVTSGIPYIDFTRDEKQGFDKLDKELRRKGLI